MTAKKKTVKRIVKKKIIKTKAKRKPTIKRKKNPDMIIHQHIKKKNGRRIGVMAGTIDADGCIRLGWSRANVNAGDKFNPKFGLKLATERLNAQEIVPVPHSIVQNMYDFKKRCYRYFKEAEGSFKIVVQEC